MNDPMMGAAWMQGLSFWCRLWQAQIEQSMKLWALWAETLPKPSAADLAAEAEKMRELAGAPSAAPVRPARRSRTATAAQPAPSATTLH